MRKELNIIRGHLALKLRGHFTFGITEKKASVNTPCYQFRKELKKLLEIIGLPGYIKELVKLSRIREALWF
ncbi:MAG: hypothetical protein ABIL44_12010 [candidate division WOR-3 bacterium]